MQIDLPELYCEKKILLKQITSFFNENRMGYINVPTGWGKTLLSLHLIKEYICQGKRILYLISRNNPLLIQTYYKDLNKNNPKFPNSLALSSDFDLKNNTIGNIKNFDVVFASLQTILSKNRDSLYEFVYSHFDFVIIDEIHNFIKNNGNKFIKKLSKNSKVFGMTATPFQGVLGKEKHVKEISLEIKEIFSKTISQCIVNGDLSPIKYTIVRNNVDIESIFDFESGLNNDGLNLTNLNKTPKKIKLIIDRTRLAKKIYDEKVLPNAKTLIFCAPTQKMEDGEKKISSFHAKLCAAIFNNEIYPNYPAGISLENRKENGSFKNTVYLSSDLGKREKFEMIREFKKENTPPYVLCTVGMITEGFDFKRLNNLILLRPTFSMRLFEQQVGRVTRTHPKKSRGNIFEIVDRINLKSLYDKFSNIFSDKTFDRLLLLNPETRIERLFLQGKDNKKLLDNKLLNINEINPKFEIKNLILKEKEYRYSETIKSINFMDYKIKLFKDMLDLSKNKETIFLEKLMLLILRFNVFTLEDYYKISQLIQSIQKRQDQARNDDSISDNNFIRISNSLNELICLIKLKTLNEIEKYPQFYRNIKSGYLNIKTNENFEELKDSYFSKGTNMSADKLFSRIRNIMKAELSNTVSFERKSIIWLATYYSENPFIYFNKYFGNLSNKNYFSGMI